MTVFVNRFRKEYLRRRRIRDRVLFALLIFVVAAAYGVADRQWRKLTMLSHFKGGNSICQISKG